MTVDGATGLIEPLSYTPPLDGSSTTQLFFELDTYTLREWHH